MLRLYIVDISADSRNKIAKSISSLQESHYSELSYLPQISIHQFGPEELKFRTPPDICLLGLELTKNDSSIVSSIRKLLPNIPIICQIQSSNETLTKIEDLARLGASDIVTTEADPIALVKKLVFHNRREKAKKTAPLILVDAAKGGMGVTSYAAAIADSALSEGKKIALIDLDLETQDLSRFLQSRPFLNDNLDLLLQQTRPITEELVMQCFTPVWREKEGLYLMSPPSLGEETFDYGVNTAKVFLSILEVIDSIFDLVIIDAACISGSLRKALYRVADSVVMVVNNDPASLYATASGIRRIKSLLAPSSKLYFVENGSTRFGLSRSVLVRELNAATRSSNENWLPLAVPFCRAASRWPGSGYQFV